MRLALLTLLPLWALNAFAASESAEELEADATAPDTSPGPQVSASASFPGTEVFGIKLVNGHATQAVLEVFNGEPEPIHVQYVGGSLWSPTPGPDNAAYIVKNLTAQRYNFEVPAYENASLTYSFATEMHPQDLRLTLGAVIVYGQGEYYPIQVFNETVSVVEAPISLFDPQIIFLYLFLASLFAGTCFFIYRTWIKTLFPQKRGRGKGGERPKTSSASKKKVEPADQAGDAAADGPAVTTGAKAYDESWIPAQHLQRPEAKRMGSSRSGTPKTKARP